MPWLAHYNPEIDWRTGEVKMTRCPEKNVGSSRDQSREIQGGRNRRKKRRKKRKNQRKKER